MHCENDIMFLFVSSYKLFAFAPVRPVSARFSTPSMRIHLCVTRPCMWQAGSRSFRSILNKHQELVIGHCLAELPKDIVIHVTRISATFEERASLIVSGDWVFPGKQVCTHGKKNGVRVGIRTHV